MTEKRVDFRDGGFWLDISGTTPSRLQKLHEEFDFHDLAVQDVLDATHLPKRETVGGWEFVILRAWDEDASASAVSIEKLTRKLALFVREDQLITLHRVDQKYIEDVRHRWMGSSIEQDPVFDLAFDLMLSLLLSFERPLQQLLTQLDSFEAHVFTKTSSTLSNHAFFLIRRKATLIQRVLVLNREVIQKIHIFSEKRPQELNNLKETAQKLIFMAEGLVTNVDQLFATHVSLATFRLNEVMKVLTVFSVIFLPLTFIAGIYGMNFENMPELKWPHGYYGALALMGGVGFAIWAWFKKRNWI